MKSGKHSTKRTNATGNATLPKAAKPDRSSQGMPRRPAIGSWEEARRLAHRPDPDRPRGQR